MISEKVLREDFINYYSLDKNFPLDTVLRILDEQEQMAGRKAKIRCITTDRIFDSISDASFEYRVAQSNLSNCLSGRLATAGKYNGEKLKWEYM